MSPVQLTPRVLSMSRGLSSLGRVLRLRLLLAIGLIMTLSLNESSTASAEDGIRFPSSIAGLNLFMRHASSTAPRRGPPVLILQGATFPSASAAGWKIDGRSWMDELASSGYDVYALDFLGYGGSDRYPEMASTNTESTGAPLGDVREMVAQVDAAVAQILKLHGGENINLVAHSAGTFVAGRYAELHPDRVARLVLFGAPAPYEAPSQENPSHENATLQNPTRDNRKYADTTPAPSPTARYADVSREEQLEGFEPKVRDTRQLDPVMFEAWVKAYLATDPQSANRNPASVRIPTGMFAAVADMRRLGRLPYDPHKITTPVLLIQGEWDAVSPPAAGLWLYERLGSPLKRFVIISQTGHRAHLERNRWQLYKETEGFLNGGDESDGPAYAVFFEVKPNGDKGRQQYLETAKALKDHLETMSGFLSIERFDNKTRPGWVLSLSRWRDEAAIIAWREVFEHRTAQERGRHGVFEDYRLRVAKEVDHGGNLTFVEGAAPESTATAQTFNSLSEAGHSVTLVESADLTVGSHWQVIRDYGLHDRREAPHD